MPFARRLLAFCGLTLVAMALPAAFASAQITVQEEENPSGAHACPEVLVNPNDHYDVTGGCHVEFESEEDIPLIAHITGVGEVQVSSCEVALEMRIAGNGYGYVTESVLSAPHGSGTCTRVACDDESSRPEPWPLRILENGPGDEGVEGTFCIRPTSAAPGTSGSKCEVHPFLFASGTHDYELDLNGAECEVDATPGVHVAIAGHLVSHEDEVGGEEIEVAHP